MGCSLSLFLHLGVWGFCCLLVCLYSWMMKISHETCQWLKFPPNGLRAQNRVSPVVGLLPSASGPACLGMAFPPFLMKQLYRCDSVVISSFVRTGYTTRRWGWLLGRIGHIITHHYPYILSDYLLFVVHWIQSIAQGARCRMLERQILKW